MLQCRLERSGVGSTPQNIQKNVFRIFLRHVSPRTAHENCSDLLAHSSHIPAEAGSFQTPCSFCQIPCCLLYLLFPFTSPCE